MSKLGLKGAERDIYAVLFGFTQEGSWFYGSVRYIASMVGVSYQTAINCLQSLKDKGLIEKVDNENGQPHKYRVVLRENQIKPDNGYKEVMPIYDAHPAEVTEEEERAFRERWKK